MGATFVCAPQHHGTAAHGTGHPRFDHTNGKAYGDGGIDRVTACGEDFGANLGGNHMLGCDNTARCGRDTGFAGLLAARERPAHATAGGKVETSGTFQCLPGCASSSILV